MEVSKKERKILDRTIQVWVANSMLSAADADRLTKSYTTMSFDWQRLAKYAFWIAIACIIIAVNYALTDRWLRDLLQALLEIPDLYICAFFAICATLLYGHGIRRRQRFPEKIFSNEAILFLGVAATAAAITFLGHALSTDSDHFSLLLLLAAIIYAVLGLWFPSKMVWIFALLSLGAWFGAETGYISSWKSYFFGMNYPVRFTLFGFVVLASGWTLFSFWSLRSEFLKPTKVIGLLYLFISLWALSIAGNHADYKSWEHASMLELLHWSLLFLAVAIVSIWHGIKYDDAMTRGFGLVFIFINLFSRFFECFWDLLPKAAFFTLLAICFWGLGAKAEKIWTLTAKAAQRQTS